MNFGNNQRLVQWRSKCMRGLLLLALTMGLAACGSSPVQFPQSDQWEPVTSEQAYAAYEAADSRLSLLSAIEQLKKVALQDLDDYDSRARLANAYTLLGAAYTEGASAKAAAYQQARHYAEAAFNTRPGYHQARLDGQSFEEALHELGKGQMEAMEFWKTATFYAFREAGSFAKLLRYSRLKEAVAVMKRQQAIERQAMWGNNLMSWGIYYLAQPEWYGGDREKARVFLAEAVAVNQNNIVPRWARGKYFAVAMDDREGFRKDLEWVAAQPLDELVGYTPWNRALKREATVLLQQESEFFG